MIGPQLGASDTINKDVLAKLDREYKRIISREANAHQSAMKEMKRYVEEIRQQTAPAQPQAVPESERSEKTADGAAA